MGFFAEGCQFYDEHSSKNGHLAALCSFERLDLREVLLCTAYSCGRNKHIRRCSPPVSNVTRIPILYWQLLVMAPSEGHQKDWLCLLTPSEGCGCSGDAFIHA